MRADRIEHLSWERNAIEARSAARDVIGGLLSTDSYRFLDRSESEKLGADFHRRVAKVEVEFERLAAVLGPDLIFGDRLLAYGLSFEVEEYESFLRHWGI